MEEEPIEPVTNNEPEETAPEQGRTVQVCQLVADLFEAMFPTDIVRRTYTPEIDLETVAEEEKKTFLIILEDATPDINTINGKKWTDIITVTVAVCKKIIDKANPTPEVDALITLVETIRDTFHWTKHEEIVITSVEHIGNRPIYVQEELEISDLFVGCVVLTVKITGTRE